MKTRFGKLVPLIARVSRGLLVLFAVYAFLFTLIWAPMLFGFQPEAVLATESDAYPVGAFLYGDTGSIALREGNAFLLETRDGAEVRIFAGSGEAPNTVRTISGLEIRTEYIAGVPGSFCIPHFGGVFLLCFSLSSLCVAVVLAALLAVFSFWLPRFYERHGRKPEEATDNAPITLHSDALRKISFQRLPGGVYSADEVDGVLRKLISAAEKNEAESEEDRAARYAAMLEIRAEMTETITQAVLKAERDIAPLTREK